MRAIEEHKVMIQSQGCCFFLVISIIWSVKLMLNYINHASDKIHASCQLFDSSSCDSNGGIGIDLRAHVF